MAREMSNIEKYYNKFNEDKRLKSRHGIVEYTVTMKYIHDYLEEIKKENSVDDNEITGKNDIKSSEVVTNQSIKILDIGAGTGRYSISLADEGYDVTAVELVKYNLGILKKHSDKVNAIQGNALNLKKLEDNAYDLTIMFGPMYHLLKREEKIRALKEASRVTKKGGRLMVAYCMNEYAVLVHGFRDNYYSEAMENNRLSEDYRCIPTEDDLYDYVRISDINSYNKDAGLIREKIFSPDGPADYMRSVLNKMDKKTFDGFINYQLAMCEREDLMGAGSHVVDVLRV